MLPQLGFHVIKLLVGLIDLKVLNRGELAEV